MRSTSTTLYCLLALGFVANLAAQEPVSNLQYMVGERAGALDDLAQRGYGHVRTEKQGGSSYSYWRENYAGRCIVARTSNGRVASIVHAPNFDCDRESQGDDWGSGGGSSSYGVTLYRDPNFGGVSETFTGDVPDMRRTRIGDDQATSVSISRGCRARLYRDLDFAGGFTEVTGDIRDLRGSQVGDDSVTSMQVRCNGGGWGGGDDWGSGGGSSSYGVTLYRDPNFGGLSETFTGDVPDMRRTRIGDDQATSVSISRGCRARLYRDLDFAGGYTEVTGDIRDLRGSQVGDDSVTSMQVRCDR